MPQSWLDPRIEIRVSPTHGRGSFALTPIAAGEVITVWEHELVDAAAAAQITSGELWPRDEGTFVWLPPNDATSSEHFLNHSCDPNVWMLDAVTLATRRKVAQGEELTTDYALFELDPNFRSAWSCRCGASCCRGGFTGCDFELPEQQQRYGAHFHPVLLRRIRTREDV